MAESSQTSAQTFTLYEAMRKKWMTTIYENAPAKVDAAKKFFNLSFGSKRSNIEFTVAQIYSGVYEILISTTQYDKIKRQLYTITQTTAPDIRPCELLDGGRVERRSFKSLSKYRNFKENELPKMNKPIVAKKRQEAEEHYQRVVELFQKKEQIISFDIEVYEYDHDIMLEIGYTVVSFSSSETDGLPQIEDTTYHFIIKENIEYENNDKVPNNRDGFKFGSSATVAQHEALEKFKEDVDNCHFVLGHSVKHDLDYLRKHGVNLAEFEKEMMDTQLIEIHKVFQPDDKTFFTPGLKTLLKKYGVDSEDEHLHNAGNDAYYTMMTFLRQMGYSADTVNELSTHA